jgi:predicted short-subunit dehydrogenase-like oxidoreductase (DUF2520 family)
VNERVFILGAGRAGQGLARALRASGVEIVGLHGTKMDDTRQITAGVIPDSIGRATVVLVAVRDAQLDAALREVARSALSPSAVLLHASGGAEPAALDELRATGRAAGTFHPLVPLSDPERAAAVLDGAWIGIDGDAAALEVSRRLARGLSAHTVVIPPGAKARYHAAAVFAANFPTVLAAIAHRLLRDAGIREADGWDAVLHLMVAAVGNIHAHRPADALTGPIVRGDVETVAHHLEALAEDREALDIYRSMSRAALALASEAGTSPALLEQIRERLEES